MSSVIGCLTLGRRVRRYFLKNFSSSASAMLQATQRLAHAPRLVGPLAARVDPAQRLQRVDAVRVDRQVVAMRGDRALEEALGLLACRSRRASRAGSRSRGRAPSPLRTCAARRRAGPACPARSRRTNRAPPRCAGCRRRRRACARSGVRIRARAAPSPGSRSGTPPGPRTVRRPRRRRRARATPRSSSRPRRSARAPCARCAAAVL